MSLIIAIRLVGPRDGGRAPGASLHQGTRSSFAPPCPADVSGNLTVDIDDVFAVLAAWGEDGKCREDVNDDGTVDIDDIFEVLAAWGPCE